MIDLLTAKAWLHEARESHTAWRDHVADHGPECCNDPIRSLNWSGEQKWVERYDALLALVERFAQAADDALDRDTLG